MDGLMGFVQVDEQGRAAEFPEDLSIPTPDEPWHALHNRMTKLLRMRGRNGHD